MTKKVNNKLYDDILKISREYLGPAAERFLNRQIRMHLDKEPHEITQEDVKKLVKWMQPAFSHITHDQRHIDGFTKRLNKLAKINKLTER